MDLGGKTGFWYRSKNFIGVIGQEKVYILTIKSLLYHYVTKAIIHDEQFIHRFLYQMYEISLQSAQ